MGIPDFALFLKASVDARKKRWLVRNELEEWSEALDEETANYPDNCDAVLDIISESCASVPEDRFMLYEINAS